MTDRELVTLTAALLAARRRDWSPETAAAEAFRLWYFVGGELSPPRLTVTEEPATEHLRNALTIIVAAGAFALSAEDVAAVRRRIEQALAALAGA